MNINTNKIVKSFIYYILFNLFIFTSLTTNISYAEKTEKTETYKIATNIDGAINNEVYEVTLEDEKNKRSSKIICNQKGNILKRLSFEDNKLRFKRITSYQSSNERISEIKEIVKNDNEEEQVAEKRVYVYSDDGMTGECFWYRKGKIAKIDIRKYNENGKILNLERYNFGEPKPFYKSTFKYNQDGNEIEILSYSGSRLSSKCISSYDPDGNKIQQDNYDKNGKLYVQYKFDYADKKLKSIHYESFNQKIRTSTNFQYGTKNIEINHSSHRNNRKEEMNYNMKWNKNIPYKILQKILIDNFS